MFALHQRVVVYATCGGQRNAIERRFGGQLNCGHGLKRWYFWLPGGAGGRLYGSDAAIVSAPPDFIVMHSSTELTSARFQVTCNGQRCSSFADLTPGFTAQERLGIVIRDPMQAIWASGLIMSAVTAFYDIHRQSGEDYFIYPDYFMFGINCVPGDYGMLDIWPDHKRITVGATTEECVRAINDRGVTILVLPDTTPRAAELERQTRSSYLQRLKFGLVYEPGAVIGNSDIQITCPPALEPYLDTVISDTPALSAAARAALRTRRQGATASGAPVEYYRRVAPATALNYL